MHQVELEHGMVVKKSLGLKNVIIGSSNDLVVML